MFRKRKLIEDHKCHTTNRYVSTVTLQQQRSFLTWEMLQCFFQVAYGVVMMLLALFGAAWRPMYLESMQTFRGFPVSPRFFPWALSRVRSLTEVNATHITSIHWSRISYDPHSVFERFRCRHDSPPLSLKFKKMNFHAFLPECLVPLFSKSQTIFWT